MYTVQHILRDAMKMRCVETSPMGHEGRQQTASLRARELTKTGQMHS